MEKPTAPACAGSLKRLQQEPTSTGIAELLAGGLPDLATFLELHEGVLRLEAKRVEVALSLLSAARLKLARHGDLSSDDLMNLTKEIAMTEDRKQDLSAAYPHSLTLS